MQTKQNLRRAEAKRSRDQLTEPAQRRHEINLKHFGQWQVLDDGVHTAKITLPGTPDEYLVQMQPKVTCTCYEVQEMIWPCQHVMAWDDRDGRDYRKHFHKCWKTASLRALYSLTIPCFLINDLSMSLDCLPPNIAVKKGRHRVVRMDAGRHGRRPLDGDDIEVDADGNIIIKYPIHDDPALLEAMPTIGTVGARGARQTQQRRNRNSGTSKRKCGTCGTVGHNRRTCPERGSNPHLVTAEEVTVEAEEEEVHFTSGAPIPTPLTAQDEAGFPIYAESSGESDASEHGGHPIHGQSDVEWHGDGAAEFVDEIEVEHFVSIANACRFEFLEDNQV